MTVNYEGREAIEFIPVEYKCDRCQKVYSADNESGECEEFLRIDYVAGYETVFSDTHRVTCDLCQYCVRELLLPFLRIEPSLQHGFSYQWDEESCQYVGFLLDKRIEVTGKTPQEISCKYDEWLAKNNQRNAPIES